MSITYRKIKRADYRQIESIMNESFGMYQYIPHPKVLACVLKTYLQNCLSEQTFTCVAEENGKIIGVIMGQAKCRHNLISHLPYFASMSFYGASMASHAVRYHCGIGSYKKMHETYLLLLKNREKEFDGILTLFAVRAEYRGRGIGKELLHRFLRYEQAQGVNRFYLYTDSTCTYSFYDAHDFILLGEQAMEATCEGKRKSIFIYLYEYNMRDHALE